MTHNANSLFPSPGAPRDGETIQRNGQVSGGKKFARLLALLAGFAALAWGRPAPAGILDDQTVPGKWLQPLLPEKGPEPAYPEYDKNNPLAKAHDQMWAGQYRRALVTLASAPQAKAVDITLIRGESQLALGRFDAALATTGQAAVADAPAVLVLRARIQAAQDDYTAAVATLQRLLTGHPETIAAHSLLGQYREELGDIAGAKAAYEWFVTDPHNLLQAWQGHPETFNDAADVTYLGQAIDRWATLTGAYTNDVKLHDVVLNMFIRAYDQIDQGYWPAHVAAAEYFATCDDIGSAMKELKSAVTANPDCADAWELFGKIQLQQFNFDGVDKAVAELRQVNADSIAANLLEARNLLGQYQPKLAMAALQPALAMQGRNVEALGLTAAAEALLLHDEQTGQILKRVDEIDPNNASAYLDVADQLAAMRQYPRAAAMYQIAIGHAPWSTAARNGLGLLETQSGDEDAARTVLEAAHTLDPYNYSTTNYLRLLDMMDKFARKESGHFIVMYDAAQDPVIPEYFSDYLESVYPQVTAEYGYEPKVKTIVEVFPTQEQFAVRTTGAPWLPTVGASTGRIIALVAPRKGAMTGGTFNWSQVLRHEFTHTVTLGETDNRISHWFTEGLAVQQEHSPIRWEWVPMLYDAVTKHHLFAIDELTWAFIRPRRPIDRQLAYAQSEWICEYIEQTYGHKAILAMLDQYRLGHSEDEIFQNALKCSETQFSDEFEKWCEAKVAGWGYDPATSKQYAQLREEGENLLTQKDYAKAIDVWEEIARIRPVDLLPHKRLAGLYIVNKQPEKAAEQLAILARVDLNNNMYTKGAARIYSGMGNFAEAAKWALRAVYIDPYDVGAHQMLADLDEKLGNQPGLEREQRVLKELAHWREAAAGQPN